MRAGEVTWTESLIARLVDLWSQGLSLSRIGLEMGISRSAVSGKIGRLGLPGRQTVTSLPRPRREPKPRKAAAPRRRKPTLVTGAPAPSAAAPRPIGSGRCCEWPLWPDNSRPPRPPLLCGAPITHWTDEWGRVQAASYCAEHYLLSIARRVTQPEDMAA